MRPRALVVLFAALVVVTTASWVLAAEQTAPVEPPILDQIKEALGGLALLVVTIVAAFVAKALPGLLEAARLWLVERATSERVQRIDDALDVALDAGNSAETAARVVTAKLPKTLQRSGKNTFDLEDEAETRRRARQNTARPAAK